MKAKITAVLFSVIIIAVTALAIINIKRSKDSFVTKTFTSMDTAVSVSIWGSQFNNELYTDIKSRIETLSETFDAYNANGQIYKLNQEIKLECSPEALDILSKTLTLQKKYKNVNITSGKLISLWDFQSENPDIPAAEDIKSAIGTIGSDNIQIENNTVSLKNGAKIDLSSCAKGYTCDLIKEQLDKSKASCAIISFGSSTLFYGEKPNDEAFTVAVRSPDNSGGYIGTLKTKSCVISSSGGYERYFEKDGKIYTHILDLETGYPAETDLTSVTVISQNGLLTDFLSTEIYIGGTKNIENYLNSGEYSIIAADENHKIYISDIIKDDFEITDQNFSFKQKG